MYVSGTVASTKESCTPSAMTRISKIFCTDAAPVWKSYGRYKTASWSYVYATTVYTVQWPSPLHYNVSTRWRAIPVRDRAT